MKESNIAPKTSFFKRIFIKICRLIGYEIIDQSKYEIPTLNKKLGDSISVPGKKSITIPLGEIKITRKINSLKIIFRSCTSELIMDQNKKRLFEKDKNNVDYKHAKNLINDLSIKFIDCPITSIFNIFVNNLDITDDKIALGNVKARIRMTLLYYYANIYNYLVVGTGDLSEKLMGYFTKYGDGGADFFPISHLYKSQINH